MIIIFNCIRIIIKCPIITFNNSFYSFRLNGSCSTFNIIFLSKSICWLFSIINNSLFITVDICARRTITRYRTIFIFFIIIYNTARIISEFPTRSLCYLNYSIGFNRSCSTFNIVFLSKGICIKSLSILYNSLFISIQISTG